jgi:hypothetical protein
VQRPLGRAELGVLKEPEGVVDSNAVRAERRKTEPNRDAGASPVDPVGVQNRSLKSRMRGGRGRV